MQISLNLSLQPPDPLTESLLQPRDTTQLGLPSRNPFSTSFQKGLNTGGPWTMPGLGALTPPGKSIMEVKLLTPQKVTANSLLLTRSLTKNINSQLTHVVHLRHIVPSFHIRKSWLWVAIFVVIKAPVPDGQQSPRRSRLFPQVRRLLSLDSRRSPRGGRTAPPLGAGGARPRRAQRCPLTGFLLSRQHRT